MIGGFLGAGKTTAVSALAQRLVREGLRVGLITNDQGSELVDTAMLRARGFATEEIPGGCFCCRFNSLVEAAGKLTHSSQPDAFVAEPVGSCTDLVATVTYPLRRMYGDRFRIAPLSVLVDPVRAEQVFGLAPGRKFSEKVLYIWRKQAEEADLLVITKTDLVDSGRLERLRERLTREFPGKEILSVSVRTGTGVEAWFERILGGEQQARPVMAVDYDLYAEGEALLGWLNATVQLAGPAFDANALIRGLADDLRTRLSGAEIAEMTFNPDEGLGDIAAVSLVRSDYVPELGLTLEGPAESGQLILNLRAEADPEALRRAVDGAPAAAGSVSGPDRPARARGAIPSRSSNTHSPRHGFRPCFRMSSTPSGAPALLYCHCQYAQVVPADVKAAVLKNLCASKLPFEAVPDLCELSARRDPALQRFAAAGPVKVAACFPRAVKWLFAAANAPLPAETTEVINMRTQSADEVIVSLHSPELTPNLPTGKVTAADAPRPNPESAS